MTNKINEYLKKYSVKPDLLHFNPVDNLSCAVVIPAINEFENIKSLLSSLSLLKEHSGTLFLFVINNPVSASDEIKNDNFQSIKLLKDIIHNNGSDSLLVSSVIESGLNIALIDASSPGMELPEKHAGVGLARKIGMDASLTLLDPISPLKNILICLDADCTVLPNYIQEIRASFNKPESDVASIHFEHNIDDESEYTKAIICYELFLRYYVNGLKYAGSPYGFHSVGSSMACSVEAYIKVEGMNKRKAAEDFYFLQKLAKNYPLSNITSTTIFPSKRPSSRVPFGTGQRVSRFIRQPGSEYFLYNPLSFEVLKEWLFLFNSKQSWSPDNLLSASKNISQGLSGFLVQNNFVETWSKIINNSKDEAGLSKQRIQWFDGFKTLKLIHYLRDNSFPQIDMFDALDQFLFKFGIPKISKRDKGELPPLNVQKEYLKILREFDLNI